jgi:ATPase subunit of ABC transporter with duplicated ATPase domains
VIVSHDRQLLDALTSTTLRVHGRTVTRWAGPYSAAREAWTAARSAEDAAHRSARSRLRHTELRLDEARRRVAATALQKSARRRMKDRHDSDARGVLATTRAA